VHENTFTEGGGRGGEPCLKNKRHTVYLVSIQLFVCKIYIFAWEIVNENMHGVRINSK